MSTDFDQDSGETPFLSMLVVQSSYHSLNLIIQVLRFQRITDD